MADPRYVRNGRQVRSYDQWLCAKAGMAADASPAELRRWQLAALSRQAAYAAEKSSFYRQLYAGYDLNDPLSLPFICERDLREAGWRMSCLPGSDIKRVVSMYTSGSTGKPKRLFFSEADLELTMDFFAQGMLYMTGPGQRVMVCMNGRTPDGLGDLLARALLRIGTEPLIYNDIADPADAAAFALAHTPHCVIGIPGQVLAMAELSPALRPRTVLLSADNVPQALRRRVEELWQTEVFSHWGMRETGLGGAVECPAHAGQHIRHADLFLEIIDPESGAPLPAGEKGEVVVSTLNREALPLIRYRTGDYSYLIDEPCPCGSLYPRLGEVEGHKAKILEEENL